MNLFRTSAMPNLNRIFADAQVRVPHSEIKPLISAYEQLRDAGTRAAEAKGKLEAAESAASEATQSIASVRDRVGLDMASGALDEAGAAEAIRAAQITEEVKRAKVAGLQKQLQAIESECASAAGNFSEAHAAFRLAARNAAVKRFREASEAFISAVSTTIALDSELRLQLIGLFDNRVVDLDNPGLPEDFTSFYQHTAAKTIIEGLEPLRRMLADAERLLADHNRPPDSSAPTVVGLARDVFASAA